MVAAVQLTGVSCPFRAVAEYPPALPYVGQDACFHRLRDLISSMQQEEQAHFLAIFGDWAIGKSRLAHELIAQFCGHDKGWLLSDGSRDTCLLQPFTAGGTILPLFVSFVDVLNFERFGIDIGTAMGKITCAAAAGLANLRRARSSPHSDLLEALRRAMSDAHPHFNFEQLDFIAHDASRGFVERAGAITKALEQMAGGQVARVLIIVDEVESSGDMNPFANEFGPGADEVRQVVSERPIPLASIRDLYSGVKDAANTNVYPRLNFIFLNTLLSQRVAQMDALQRRMTTADLEKANAPDLALLMQALREQGYPLHGTLEHLARRAFFVADRSFGWFSFIMNKAHFLLTEKPTLSISEVFAEVCKRTGRVFQARAFEDRSIDPPMLKNAMRSILYNQEPTTLEALGEPAALLPDLLGYQDPSQTPFVGEAAIIAVSADQLTQELLATGRYKSDQKLKLTGDGSVNFDTAELLASLRTFAWTHDDPADGGQERLWFYLDPVDFEGQVAFAYRGFRVNLSAATVRLIHSILLERYRVPQPAPLVAPTMALLQRFNDLWGKTLASNWLSDTLWDQVVVAVEQRAGQHDQLLLQGIANTLFDHPQPVDALPYKDVRGTALLLRVDYGALNVTTRSQLLLLKARETAEGVLEDIRNIRPAIPTLLIFGRASERDAWELHIREAHQEHLAATVIPRIVEPQTREWEFYLRYALCDQPGGFKASDVTAKGKDLRREFKEALEGDFDQWLASADERGTVLRPFYPTKNANASNFQAFADAYAALWRAGSAAALIGQGSFSQESLDKALADYEREQREDTLRLIDDKGQQRRAVAPPILSRILQLLQVEPRKLPELNDQFFYKRSERTVNFPTNAVGVLEQVMTLLQKMELVKVDPQNRYVCRSATSLDHEFDLAIQHLGTFDGAKSGYAGQVSAFSKPIQQLALQLAVNEDQLRLLKDQELKPRRQELHALPLARLAELPPDQQAFAAVTRSIGQITTTISKVLGEAVQPPAIDPLTLQDRIDEMLKDKAYQHFSIEYRINFLKLLQEKLATREQQLRQVLEERQTSITQQYMLNNGLPFPTQPMLQLLAAVKADLDDALGSNSLSPHLQRKPGDAALKILKGAGRLSDVLLKLEWYHQQLDSGNRESWWVKYTSAYEAWKDALTLYERVADAWTQVERYFQGTAPEHTIKFTGPELERDVREMREDVQNFGTELDRQQHVTLDDVTSEIKGVRERCADAEKRMQAALAGATDEIKNLLAGVAAAAAVRRLAERFNQTNILPNQQKALEARTHHEAHSAVDHYRDAIQKMGAALCAGRPELFERYQALHHDKQHGLDGDALLQKYGKDVLEEMGRQKLIALRTIVEF